MAPRRGPPPADGLFGGFPVTISMMRTSLAQAEASAWLSRAWAADRLWPCRSMVMSGVRFPLRILRSQPESRVAAGVRGWAAATVRAEGTVNPVFSLAGTGTVGMARSDEHTSELQSLMRISYDDFSLQKKT